MKHLGDITKIHGDRIETVDIITFGSPCQDLSIAGNRAGLDGERSGLFMEAVRIIKEMRCKTNGRFPTYAVWENVPGAFSSQKGEGFRVVLEELCKICKEDASIPRPPDKWRTSGTVMGDWWSIAWRVFDAQFWGVPQRRRRIALVVDFRGGRAPEILFERKSVRRDFEAGEEERKGTAGTAENGTIAAGFQGKASPGAGSIGYMPDGCPTLIAGRKAHVMCVPDVARTLTASFGGSPCPDRGHGANIVAIPINDKATRYKGGGETRNHDGSGNGLGIGKDGDPAATITAGDRHAVMCMATGQGNTEILHDTSPTLNCDHEQPICLHPDISGTICASGAGTDRPAGQGNEGDLCIVQGNYIVRRLTPLECERLQGYPDGWVHIPDYIGTDGKKRKVSDSAMYKALGNSISIPNWKYVMKRIAATFERDATFGSLFDGIGGFPMIWEQLNGKKSARWASEIEEFPIAVAKYRIE